ncbi:hypothetical protein KI387_012086, partial [Taxus chinensis]
MDLLASDVLAFQGNKGHLNKGSNCQSWRSNYIRQAGPFGYKRLKNKCSFNHGNIHSLKVHASVAATPVNVTDVEEIVKGEITENSKHVAWKSVARERWEGELEVQGYIPKWLTEYDGKADCRFEFFQLLYKLSLTSEAIQVFLFGAMNGTYLRNGPGKFHIGDYNVRHLFDGYSTLVRLHFEEGRLIAGHAQLQSEAYKAATKNNKICYREFSEVPKPANFFAYVGDLAGLFSGASLTDNANTGVIRLGDGRVVCLTETMKGSIEINPTTLETMGKFEYTDNLGGLIHSAHPIVFDTEFITLLPDLINPGYDVVRMLPGTNERTLIGR